MNTDMRLRGQDECVAFALEMFAEMKKYIDGIKRG